MTALVVLYLIVAVFLLFTYCSLPRCRKCGRLFPLLTHERKLNRSAPREEVIVGAEIAYAGLGVLDVVWVVDVVYCRTYRCADDACMHIWNRVERETELYEVDSGRLPPLNQHAS